MNKNIKNIMEAIEYIEAHLTESLELDKVAEAVHYSKYHLHRTFSNTVGTILKALNGMLIFRSTLALYRDFYRQAGKSDMFVMPDKKTLEWPDVFPFLYFHAAFSGLKESRDIRHLVVDEMQDYTPVQYAVLNKLFRCQKTILGDFGQFIHPNHLNTLEDMRQIYQGAEYVELNKSYRSTYEIICFAGRIQKVHSLEPVSRHGDAPFLIGCGDRQREVDKIIEIIDVFEKSSYKSLGIITKTYKEAEALYEELTKKRDIHLLSPDSRRFVNGVSVTSVQMSKGLEFDEVIIPGADKDTYAMEYDRSLLYIACTRAMHRLTLTYTGTITNLIED